MKKSKRILVKRRRQQRAQRRSGGVNLLVRATSGVVGVVLVTALLVVLSGVGTVVGVWAYFTKDLPDPEDIQIVEDKFHQLQLLHKI